MGTLATFTKQPADVQDYDIDYNEWLTDLDDVSATHTVTAEAGITVSSFLLYGIVKVWASGGTDGTKYKVTATLTTLGGRTKQSEITIKVKEV